MATLICEKRGRKRSVKSAAPRPRRNSTAPACFKVSEGAEALGQHPLEQEWDAMLHESQSAEESKHQERVQEHSQQVQKLEALLARCEGKRWMVSEARDAAAELSRLQQLTPSAGRSETLLAPYKNALRSLQQRSSAVSSMMPSRMERNWHTRVLPSAPPPRSSATRAPRPNVLLMTPENATRSLTLHLQSSLGQAPPPLLLTVGDICDECGVQMKVIANDSMLGCSSCHKTRLLPNTTTVTVSSTGEFDYSSAAMHQKHRLPEWIEMAQAKQFAEPPLEVLETVVEHLVQKGATGLSERDVVALRKERVRGGVFLDAKDAIRRLEPSIPHIQATLLRLQSGVVRRALRDIVQVGGSARLRKYYEHSAKCASYISGFWPPRMNAQQEEVLRLVYAAAAPAYEARRKPTQHYWPGGFPYFLRSACALLGWDEFVPLFPLPPGSREGGGRHALRKAIWENDLGWELVPAFAPLPPIRIREQGTQDFKVFQLLEDDGMDEEDGDDSSGEQVEAPAKKKRRAL